MHGKLCLFFILVSLLALTVSGTNAQDNFNITPIVQYDNNWHSEVLDVAIQNGYALLACGSEGLRIVSGYDSENPSVIGHISDIGAEQVVASGNYAYVSCWWDAGYGIRVIDISNPAQPREVAQVADVSYKLRIIGDHLYACGDSVFMVDISNPLDPQIVWRRPLEDDARGMDVANGRAYIADGNLDVWDLSDISNPQPLYTISPYTPSDDAYAEDVRVSGNYAYVAYGNKGLQIIDLTVREVVSQVDSLTYAYTLELRDNLVYLYYGPFDCPLGIIDISNPLSPQVTGIYEPPMYLGGFALQGNRAYVADLWYGLRTVDISDPYHPTEIHRYNRCGDYHDVKAVGNRAYVLSGGSSYNFRMQVMDIADRQHPTELGGFEIPGGYDLQAVSFAVQDNTCFVTRRFYGDTYLDAYDMTDPSAPAHLGTITGGGYNFGVFVHDQYAYIAGQETLHVVNISNPSAMTLAGNYTHRTSCSSLAFSGHYVYLSEDNRIVALDMSNPASPVVADTVSVRYVEQLAVSNGLLVALGYDSFYVFDASPAELRAPRSVTAYPEGRLRNSLAMAVQDQYVFFVTDSSYMYLFDLSNPDTPVLRGSYRTPGKLHGLDVEGNMIVAADESTLGIYDCSQAFLGVGGPIVTLPREVALLPNYPNPFNMSTQIPFELPAQSRVTLKVYDVLGRTVATLANGNYAAGSHIINWNGVSGGGQSVASGRYFVRFEAANKVQTRPITLLK